MLYHRPLETRRSNDMCGSICFTSHLLSSSSPTHSSTSASCTTSSTLSTSCNVAISGRMFDVPSVSFFVQVHSPIAEAREKLKSCHLHWGDIHPFRFHFLFLSLSVSLSLFPLVLPTLMLQTYSCYVLEDTAKCSAPSSSYVSASFEVCLAKVFKFGVLRLVNLLPALHSLYLFLPSPSLIFYAG